jgi:hypothetical protein
VHGEGSSLLCSVVTSEWPCSGCVVERAIFFRHGGALGCRPVAVGVCDALHMWSFRSWRM